MEKPIQDFAVSITTIHVPTIIEAVEANRIRYGHDPIMYVVTGDKKTPEGTADYCRKLNDTTDSLIVYLDIHAQDVLLDDLDPALKDWYPYNCIARRNIGDLWAWQHKAKVIVRLDDDNFPIESQDFVGGHKICSEKFYRLPMAHSSDGWFNCCNMMKLDRSPREIYPRGFPYTKRFVKREIVVNEDPTSIIAVNAGLWLGDPDIDAITRLAEPVKATALDYKRVALAKGTWCSINTQNTAIASYLLPASFASPFAQRYDDIICGYIQRTLMDLIGHHVCYGEPCVNQIRNDHNLWLDLDNERFGCQWIDAFIAILREFNPGKLTDYNTGMDELLAFLEEQLRKRLPTFWDWFKISWEGMGLWANIFRQD